jgi:hypothetical protein
MVAMIDDEVKESSQFEMAVHIRRGDVRPCKNVQRYLPNAHYLYLIDEYSKMLLQKHSNHTNSDGPPNIHVTIYSESASFEAFDVFYEKNYSVELDTNLGIVWNAIEVADVAILSRSYFSFVPAILNYNHIIVATPFLGFEPLSGWHTANTSLVQFSDAITDHFIQSDHCQ